MFIFNKIIFIFILISSVGCSSLLYQPVNQQIHSPQQMGLTYDETKITTSDGEKLNAWYFKAEKPKGLIIFFHGNAQNISTHFASLGWIVREGYSFMIFDYRGYWKSTGETTPKGTVLDGKAALKWGQKESTSLGVPLIVFGQSLGGAISLRSVAEVSPEITPQLLVVESTFKSYKSAANSVLSNASWITWPFQWLAYLVIGDKWAPKNHLQKISPTPLVVIHGTNDKVIEYDLGQELYNSAPNPKELWTVENGGHINSFWLAKGKWRKKFLEKLNNLL